MRASTNGSSAANTRLPEVRRPGRDPSNMATDLNALRARLKPGFNGKKCTVCQILERLDPDIAGIVRDALADENVRHKQIEDVLKDLEPPGAGSQAVGRHRLQRHDA